MRMPVQPQCYWLSSMLFAAWVCSANGFSRAQEELDAIVVGAGIAGLSAASEMGAAGLRVTVIDIASVFGGHAAMSQGGLAIVDTPQQRAQGIEDSPELAKRDFRTWGDDPDGAWVDYYCDHSRRDIYDWLVGLGVKFESALPAPGNSVDRTHQPIGRGLGLVTPIYRKCLDHPNVRFLWNTRAVKLIVRQQNYHPIEQNTIDWIIVCSHKPVISAM